MFRELKKVEKNEKMKWNELGKMGGQTKKNADHECECIYIYIYWNDVI